MQIRSPSGQRVARGSQRFEKRPTDRLITSRGLLLRGGELLVVPGAVVAVHAVHGGEVGEHHDEPQRPRFAVSVSGFGWRFSRSFRLVW